MMQTRAEEIKLGRRFPCSEYHPYHRLKIFTKVRRVIYVILVVSIHNVKMPHHEKENITILGLYIHSYDILVASTQSVKKATS